LGALADLIISSGGAGEEPLHPRPFHVVGWFGTLNVARLWLAQGTTPTKLGHSQIYL